MVSEKRRRELARAKWERQQVRRRAAEARARRLRLIGGVALGVAALVLVGLGIRAVVGDDSPSTPIPTENTLTFLEPTTPTDDGTTAPPTTGSTTEPTGSTTSPPRTGGTTATTRTAPVTTATTGPGSL